MKLQHTSERRIKHELNSHSTLVRIGETTFECISTPFLRAEINYTRYPFQGPIVSMSPCLHRVLPPYVLRYLNGDVLKLITSFLREPWMSPKAYILEVGDSRIHKNIRWDVVNTFERHTGNNWVPSMFIIEILKSIANGVEIINSIIMIP